MFIFDLVRVRIQLETRFFGLMILKVANVTVWRSQRESSTQKVACRKFGGAVKVCSSGRFCGHEFAMGDDCGALEALDDPGLEVCIEEVEHNLQLQIGVLIGDEQCSNAATGDEFSYSRMGASSPCEMSMPSVPAQHGRTDGDIDPLAQESSDSQKGETNPVDPVVTDKVKVTESARAQTCYLVILVDPDGS